MRLIVGSALVSFLCALVIGCNPEAPLGPVSVERASPDGGSHTFLISSATDPRLPPPGFENGGLTSRDRAIISRSEGVPADNLPVPRGKDPSLDWNTLTRDLSLKAKLPPPLFARSYALVHIAIYDAFDAAFRGDRGDLPPRAVAAGAASTVLLYLFPGDSNEIDKEAVAQLGVGRPHDLRLVLRGWALGKRVGQLAAIHGQHDGHDSVFTGTIPPGQGKWTGVNPVLPMCGMWQTWICTSGSEFQPDPPYDFGSPEDSADLRAVYQASLNHTPEQIAVVHKWADLSPPAIWNNLLNDRVAEGRLNARRAAWGYAYLNAALYDAFVSCWETKYTYWIARPFQRISGLVTVIPTPNFPSYTSGHSTISAAAAVIMGDVFPPEKDYFAAQASEAALSRLLAGIHFPHDNDQGLEVGHLIGERVARVMRTDRRQLSLASD